MTQTSNIQPNILNNPSHLSESNQRPTDYKSVALPAELKWQVFNPQIKNYPFFWEGKGKGK
jgi:hypothetical protein